MKIKSIKQLDKSQLVSIKKGLLQSKDNKVNYLGSFKQYIKL